MVDLIKTIDVSGLDANPYGLAFDGKYLWLGGRASDKIYQLDFDGNVIKSFSVSTIDTVIVSLGSNCNHLFLGGFTNGKISKIDKSGKLISDFSAANPWAMSVVDKYIYWIQDPGEYLHQSDLLGNIIRTVDITLLGNPRGLGFDGKNFWYTDITGILYSIDRDGNILKSYDLSAIDNSMQSVTFDGKYLYITGNENDSIYKFAI